MPIPTREQLSDMANELTKHENWIILRRGKVVYEATDLEDANNNLLFSYEEIVCVSDEELSKLKLKQE